jgi:hypothetical protein
LFPEPLAGTRRRGQNRRCGQSRPAKSDSPPGQVFTPKAWKRDRFGG